MSRDTSLACRKIRLSHVIYRGSHVIEVCNMNKSRWETTWVLPELHRGMVTWGNYIWICGVPQVLFRFGIVLDVRVSSHTWKYILYSTDG